MTVRRPAGGPRFLKSARDGLMFFSRRGTLEPGRTADVAQLVERNLAKVEVAGSNPVVRSERVRPSFLSGGVAERRGSGLQSRLHGFESRLHLEPQ